MPEWIIRGCSAPRGASVGALCPDDVGVGAVAKRRSIRERRAQTRHKRAPFPSHALLGAAPKLNMGERCAHMTHEWRRAQVKHERAPCPREA